MTDFVPTRPAIDEETLEDVELLRSNCNLLRIDEAGEDAPANPVAYMNWLYVPSGGSNWVVRRRNAGNTAWFDVYEIDPTTGNIVVSGLKEVIHITPEAMNTKIASGYAYYEFVEDTYDFYGEMRFDALSEVAFLPPWKLADWNEGTITVRILVKSNSTTGSGQFRLSLVGRAASTHEVWEAPMTDHDLDAFSVPGTAESLVEVSDELTVSELANNDWVKGKLTRIDTPGPSILKVLSVEFEYTRT